MVKSSDYFYLVDSGTTSNSLMFSEVKSMGNVEQTSNPFSIRNKFLSFLNRIHFSVKLNTKISIPFKGIWDHCYYLDGIVKDNKKVWIILTNWSICKFSTSYLKSVQKKGIKLVLVYLDTFCTIPKYYKRLISKIDFDLIYSFDKKDCAEFGWIYTNQLYSKLDLPKVDNSTYDVYFIGADKGRIKYLKEIYLHLRKNGLKPLFKIVSNKKYEPIDNDFIIQKKRLTYGEVLKDISESSCILDIVQKGQSGMTMRPYEALLYNKKLITNSEAINDNNAFNSKWFNFFNDISEINIDMLKDTSVVNHNYDGRFSPKRLIERIPIDYLKSNSSF